MPIPRAASFVLSKRLIAPLAVRISMGLLPLAFLGAKVFSSSVGVSMVVHVFMLFLQDYACGGVFFPLLLQHDGVALLLALVVQFLYLVGGCGVEVQFAGNVLQGVAIVGFDGCLGLLGVGGGEYA